MNDSDQTVTFLLIGRARSGGSEPGFDTYRAVIQNTAGQTIARRRMTVRTAPGIPPDRDHYSAEYRSDADRERWEETPDG